jgi:hypothetical protein
MSRTNANTKTSYKNLSPYDIQQIYSYLPPRDIMRNLLINKKTHKALIRKFQSRTHTSHADSIMLEKADMSLSSRGSDHWRFVSIKIAVSMVEASHNLYMIESANDNVKVGLIPLFHVNGLFQVEINESRYKVILNKFNHDSLDKFMFKVISVSSGQNVPLVNCVKVILTYYNYGC